MRQREFLGVGGLHNKADASIGVQQQAARGCSDTTTSMGRLTLNILLSFAQFEREVIGERVRDKIAASRARGMWMGGPVPLGYRVENRKLLVDEAAATTVRRVFEGFAEIGSATRLLPILRAEGCRAPSQH
jgi:site-specific DNA recombinase